MFTLSGLVPAKNHQLLWGEWGRMDSGAYSSVWLSRVVETTAAGRWYLASMRHTCVSCCPDWFGILP